MAEAPGTLLNIAGLAGRNRFAAQLARTGDTDILVKTQDELADGYSESPWLVTNAAGTAVRLRAPVDGPTTAGTSFTRAELRELDLTGANMKFNPYDGGRHYLKGKLTITHHPTSGADIANIGIVTAQLHNGNRDRLAWRTQYVSGTLRDRYRENGSSVWQGTDTTSGNLEIVPNPNATGSNIIGVEFPFMLDVHDGDGTSCIADFYINDLTTPWRRNTNFFDTAFDNHPDGWYFKCGAYTQFTSANVASSEYGEVQLRDLEHWHTGWPTPVPFMPWERSQFMPFLASNA